MSTNARAGVDVAEFDQLQAEGCEIVRASKHTVVVIGDHASVIAIDKAHALHLVASLREAADDIEDAYNAEEGDDGDN